MLNFLLLLIPVSLALHFTGAPALWIFATSGLAIIPLADWMRKATEQLTHTMGSGIGGLLNITFGNAAELILAIFVLQLGNIAVVKATITGSIIGNSLFGLGLAVLFGTLKQDKQSFSQQRAGLLSSMLLLVVIALMLPAIFDYTERSIRHVANPSSLDEHLSLGVSIVLIAAYVANLLYTLITHRDIFTHEESEPSGIVWSKGKALGVLLAATIVVALEADLVSEALEEAAHGLHLTPFFVGVILLPLFGNAAEYFSAIYFARKNRMDMVMTISVGASIQVALLTAPLLVIISYMIGHRMDLVFENPLELFAIGGVAFIVNSIAQDGEATWFEGVLLLAVYTLVTLAFFFVSP